MVLKCGIYIYIHIHIYICINNIHIYLYIYNIYIYMFGREDLQLPRENVYGMSQISESAVLSLKKLLRSVGTMAMCGSISVSGHLDGARS